MIEVVDPAAGTLPRRVVLVLPSGSYRAPDLLAAARTLGVEVVVASDVRQALAGVMGTRAVTIDLCDPDASASSLASALAGIPVGAVVAVDDGGVVTAARAAALLGLPHNDPAAVLATRDKSVLRGLLAAAGVDQPAYRVAGPADDIGDLAAALGMPVVVKPVSLSASRGVIRADSPDGARTAASRIRHILAAAGRDRGESLLVESFVPGREVAVEGVVESGALRLLAIFDKPDPLDGPYFEETLYVTPSRLSRADQELVEETMGAAVAALGLTTGPVHGELRVADGRARVIEVAARTIGGLCSRALRFGAGVSLEELVLRNALGLGLEGLGREADASGVMMMPIPRPGRLGPLSGLEEARAVPGVMGVEVTIPPGGRLVPLPEGDRYLGFIFARGATPAAVEAALRAAWDRIEIDVTACASC
jgi:biotin carboxylase